MIIVYVNVKIGLSLWGAEHRVRMSEKRVLKGMNMRWVGHMARMAERRVAYRGLVGNLRE
jgi:hypothetical protein